MRTQQQQNSALLMRISVAEFTSTDGPIHCLVEVFFLHLPIRVGCNGQWASGSSNVHVEQLLFQAQVTLKAHLQELFQRHLVPILLLLFVSRFHGWETDVL